MITLSRVFMFKQARYERGWSQDAVDLMVEMAMSYPCRFVLYSVGVIFCLSCSSASDHGYG